jgi:hypothetical protein
MNNNYKISFPDNYATDEYIQFEVESKGYLRGVIVIINNISYTMTFYDPVRLHQDIEEELKSEKYFFESNPVIVPGVTKNCIVEAIDSLIKNDDIKLMNAD